MNIKLLHKKILKKLIIMRLEYMIFQKIQIFKRMMKVIVIINIMEEYQKLNLNYAMKLVQNVYI